MSLTDEKENFNDVTDKAIDDLGGAMLDLVEKTEKKHKQDDVIDLNINAVQKTKIRINGDNNAILELNLSDLRIADRLEKGYAKLQQNIKKITEIDTEDENVNVSKTLNEIDKDMRDVVDYIFDTNVSEICCKDGTMFDLKNGTYRFEGILEALTRLYSETLNSEYKAMKRRVQDKVNAYIPQDHKSKAKKRKETIQKDE